MYGAKISSSYANKRDAVLEVLGDNVLVGPHNVNAYSFGEGKVTPIIDEETGLIKASLLDGVSNELAREFEQLMMIDPTE
jgi:hypothetical protein